MIFDFFNIYYPMAHREWFLPLYINIDMQLSVCAVQQAKSLFGAVAVCFRTGGVPVIVSLGLCCAGASI